MYALNASSGTLVWRYKTGGGISNSSPAVSNGVVYVGSNDANVYALNATTGTPFWTYSTGSYVVSSPAVSGGIVYVGSNDGRVYALDGVSGRLVWSYTTEGRINSSPALSGDTLYVGSQDGNLYALDAATGILIGKYPLGGSIDLSSPSVYGAFVYVGSEDGKMYAFKHHAYSDWPLFHQNANRTGVALSVILPERTIPYAIPLEVSWTYETGDPSTSGVWSSPVVSSGVVYVESDRNMYALNATTGASIWSAPLNTRGSAAVSKGLVYLGSGNDFYALDASSGAIVWNYRTAYGGTYSSPAVSAGIVYFGSFDNITYAVNATSGHLVWSYDTGAPIIFSSPAVAGGIVYIGSTNGNLYGLNATTGANIWTYKTNDAIYSSSPAVSQGIVFVGSDDHDVYALEAATGKLVWSYSTEGGIRSSPAVCGNFVYVGSQDGNLYALDSETGRLLWAYQTHSGIDSSPAVSGNVVFVASQNNLYALDAENGRLLWSYATGGGIESSPAISEGRVYVGSLDGRVYAFVPLQINDTFMLYARYSYALLAIFGILTVLGYVVSKPREEQEYMKIAVAEAAKSVNEDSRPHPKVGVVIVRDGNVQATAFRGEFPGNHGEYVALEKKLAGRDLSGATLFTTLEPCTSRNHPKIPCAKRIVERQIGKVVIGMLDPDWRVRGRGVWDLKDAGVIVEFFERNYEEEIVKMNKEFISQAFKPSVIQTQSPLASEGDSYFEKLTISYRRMSIVPMGQTVEIIPPSTENDNWLDNNRPNLMFGFPKPSENGVEFAIPGHTFAAVSKTGELYYGERLIEPLESVTLDLGATVRLVGRMLKFATAVYQRFPYRGRLTIEYRMALSKEVELTLSEVLGRLQVLGNSKPMVSAGPKSIKREIDTEDLKDFERPAAAVVNDLLRALGISVPTTIIEQLVKKYS